MPPALPTDGPVLSPPPATDGPLPVTPPPPLPHAKFASGKDVAGGPWQATPVSGDSPAAVSHAPAAAAGPGVGSHSVSITENYAIGLEVLDPEDLAPEVRPPARAELEAPTPLRIPTHDLLCSSRG